MSITDINIGTVANDGTGDTLRAAFNQSNINDNILDAKTADTRAAILTTSVPAPVNQIRTSGYAEAGDGGGALYKRATTEPSHVFKMVSQDGAWWEGVPEAGEIDIRQLGAVADWDGSSGTQNKTAIENAIAAAGSLGAAVLVPAGGRFRADDVDLSAGTTIIGRGWGSKLESSAAGSNIINLANNCEVRGVNLIGQNFGTSGNSAVDNGIFGNGVTDVRIIGCFLDKFGSSDSSLDGSGAIRFQGTCDNLRVQNNFITGGLGSTTDSNVSSDINFYGNNMSDVICTGNYCLSVNRHGIAFQIGGTQLGRRIVSNNHCSNKQEWGISLNYGDDDSDFVETICSSNVCYNCGGGGIYFASGSLGGGSCTIIGNIVSYCGGESSINGASLQGGIVTSGNLPIDILSNHVSWTGYDTSQTLRTVEDCDGIKALGAKGRVEGNTIYRAKQYGLYGDSNCTEIIWKGNFVYGAKSLAEPSTSLTRLTIEGNLFDADGQDVDGLQLILGVNDRENVFVSDNKFFGAKQATGKKGFFSAFGFAGEFKDNKFDNWDIAHDLGSNEDYWGNDIDWSQCRYTNNTLGISYSRTSTTDDPVLSYNNVFKDNTTDVTTSVTTQAFFFCDTSPQLQPYTIRGTAAPGSVATFPSGTRVRNTDIADGGTPGWIFTSDSNWKAEASIAA